MSWLMLGTPPAASVAVVLASNDLSPPSLALEGDDGVWQWPDGRQIHLEPEPGT